MLDVVYPEVWKNLPAGLRDALLEDPGRALNPDEIVQMRQAGARVGETVWLDERPGRGKRWMVSWSFRRFIEQQASIGGPHDA